MEAGFDSVRKVSVFVTSAYDITGREKKVNGLVKFTVPYKVCYHCDCIRWVNFKNSFKYEGRSINELQTFKMRKFRNVRFVGDLILSTSCEFYYDDVTVIRFRWVIELGANVIQSEMRLMYGDKSFMRPAIHV